MSSKLYVGNIAPKVTGPDLQGLFAPYGTVKWADIALDPATKQPKGFAFVMMSSEPEAKMAVTALNGKSFEGRLIQVSPAQKRKPKIAGRPRSGGPPRRGSRGPAGPGGPRGPGGPGFRPRNPRGMR